MDMDVRRETEELINQANNLQFDREIEDKLNVLQNDLIKIVDERNDVAENFI